ncbi:MAG: flagellar basal body rod protein FlgB [Verrucomicrobium sp.]|nr:flagellar basal body rod protein FlgB [Verrucomicrobium sp.]
MTSGIEKLMNEPTLASLKLTLQEASLRHDALASNVANVNTPGYHRVDVASSFASSLNTALHQIDKGETPTDIPKGTVSVADVQNPARYDGNTVNLDQEMTELMKNQSDFDFSARMLALHYSRVKQAIGGGTSGS